MPSGILTTIYPVPSTALIAVPDLSVSRPHRVYFRQYRPLGGIELSFVGSEVLKGALDDRRDGPDGHAAGDLFAIPLSFLAARNLMSGNPLTVSIYVVVRTLLNILRSIESLIIAIVFVVIVGLGPFAGVLALAIHSVAALAKLYSEVIEGIDPGPDRGRPRHRRQLAADRPLRGHPADRPAVYRPSPSTAGISMSVRRRSLVLWAAAASGFLLIELIRINDMRGVSAVFIAIAIIVMALDYISAKSARGWCKMKNHLPTGQIVRNALITALLVAGYSVIPGGSPKWISSRLVRDLPQRRSDRHGIS